MKLLWFQVKTGSDEAAGGAACANCLGSLGGAGDRPPTPGALSTSVLGVGSHPAAQPLSAPSFPPRTEEEEDAQGKTVSTACSHLESSDGTGRWVSGASMSGWCQLPLPYLHVSGQLSTHRV